MKCLQTQIQVLDYWELSKHICRQSRNPWRDAVNCFPLFLGSNSVVVLFLYDCSHLVFVNEFIFSYSRLLSSRSCFAVAFFLSLVNVWPIETRMEDRMITALLLYVENTFQTMGLWFHKTHWQFRLRFYRVKLLHPNKHVLTDAIFLSVSNI